MYEQEGELMNDWWNYLEHSAKGSTWKKHKYIKKENGHYVYPVKDSGDPNHYTNASIYDTRKRMVDYRNKKKQAVRDAERYYETHRVVNNEHGPVLFDKEHPGSQYKDNLKRVNNGDWDDSASNRSFDDPVLQAVRNKNEEKYQREHLKYLRKLRNKEAKEQKTLNYKTQKAFEKTVEKINDAMYNANKAVKKLIKKGKRLVDNIVNG